VAWITTIACSFTIRLVYPVGRSWTPLGLQLAYLPQYVLAYCGGHFSVVSDDLFVLIPFQYDTRNALRKLFRSLMLSLFSLGLLTVIEEKLMGIDTERLIQLTAGGLNFPALFYAIWNEMGFALIGFALLAAFVQNGDFPWTYGKLWLPRYSYAAFLLHPPVSVGIELALESLMGCQEKDYMTRHGLWLLFGPVLMTLVVGPLNILATWAAAWTFLSLVPAVGKII
jgi:glucans biosynthesis protein C